MHIPALLNHVTSGPATQSPANLARSQFNADVDTNFGKLVSEIAQGLRASHAPQASAGEASNDLQPQTSQGESSSAVDVIA